MFQDNPLLTQLKQQFQSQKTKVEGIVRGTRKGFGFLETEGQKSYFIPPLYMKKVMHGDRITASLRIEKDREIAEPETLIEASLAHFIGRIVRKNNQLSVLPDSPVLKEAIPCHPVAGLTQDFHNGDWITAQITQHPLSANRAFNASITGFITHAEDRFAPWWVTLSCHNLEREAPVMVPLTAPDDRLQRQDLTTLDFITIDSASTQDMDDALYVEENSDGSLLLYVAISDPTAWFDKDTELDITARKRAFTNYLPGFNIPILPRELSENLCSLHPHKERHALVCRMKIDKEGTLNEDIHFFTALITSKAKLVYDQVSDWLENKGHWQPENTQIAQQIKLLERICDIRSQWRRQHALTFKESPDWQFVFDEKGDVLDVIMEERRIANRIVEECMIAANICAATALQAHYGFGIYNVHQGFDPALLEQAASLLKTHGISTSIDELRTLDGFCAMRRQLDAKPDRFIDHRMRRFQSFAEVSTTPGPHFGLGLPAYATWTSPIRKYGDMVNQRLLKAIINNIQAEKPEPAITAQLTERRRLNRLAERYLNDWLYAGYLKDKAETDARFQAEVIDITRGGLRIRLQENGATAFIPASFLHPVRDELICSQETGTALLKGEILYRQGDIIDVRIAEVCMENRSIIARPVVSQSII